MFEMEGLDKLNKTLSELGKVAHELESELASLFKSPNTIKN